MYKPPSAGYDQYNDSTHYRIPNSLRFKGTQYLTRTFGTPTNNLKWSLSYWVKISTIGVNAWSEVPGYSKFGSYTGNGLADGPFVYCGFKPQLVLIKNTTTTGYHWILLNGTCSPINPVFIGLEFDTNLAESGVTGSPDPRGDVTSNGFKVRMSSASGGYQNTNNSGDTYAFVAFAEMPSGDLFTSPATVR